MDENIKSIVKNNALYGYKILIDDNMGYVKCPTMNDLQENMFYYIYLVNNFIDLYEDNKLCFYEVVFFNENNFRDFMTILSFFFEITNIDYDNEKIIINDKNFIDETNISVFIEIIRLLHHYDKKDDDYKPANKIAAEMMARARKLKKEIESKIKSKDGVGFLEMTSTICARHPSINLTNIGKLNYYQIIDQYKRLMMIDLYTPCLYGNAGEDYIKNNKVKHYSQKIINE